MQVPVFAGSFSFSLIRPFFFVGHMFQDMPLDTGSHIHGAAHPWTGCSLNAGLWTTLLGPLSL